jgi:hypothetical protein
MKLQDFLSSDSEKSSKRLVFLVSFLLYGIQHFLLMYLKIEIANATLVKSSQDGLFWICVTSGCLVAGEPGFNKIAGFFNSKTEPPKPDPQ